MAKQNWNSCLSAPGKEAALQAISEGLTRARRNVQPRLVILGEFHCENLLFCMQSAGYWPVLSPFLPSSTPALHAVVDDSDAVVIDVTTAPGHILQRLDALNAAIGVGNIRPRVLCFSIAHRNPNFVAGIEKCGARYVRISDPTMLLEAVDLLLWEMNELDSKGPFFRITHKYCQGLCAPGEEVTAIEIGQNGRFFHLPFGLAERLVFDILAHHQRIALDSSQITLINCGDWFYRDHGLNAGHRQFRKIRRPSVKVIIQRIREGMGFVFDKARLTFNPYDVLRSCPAAGSNRILYKLNGQIAWHHPFTRR